jgi:DNA-binding response OmpR family regulator
MAPRTLALLIEDDARLAALVAEFLAQHAVDVTVAPDGERGLRALRERSFDVILLDLMLPGVDGLEITRRIRADRRYSAVPIIMLTAKGDDVDKIVGLEIGADDYLAKPYNPRELLARIRAVLRRAGGGGERERLRIGELELDLGARTVKVGARPVALTHFEFELLAELARASGRVLSRDALMEKLKGEEFESFDRSIDVHISKLRQKLEDNPKEPRYIRTVRGVGYVLSAEDP